MLSWAKTSEQLPRERHEGDLSSGPLPGPRLGSGRAALLDQLATACSTLATDQLGGQLRAMGAAIGAGTLGGDTVGILGGHSGVEHRATTSSGDHGTLAVVFASSVGSGRNFGFFADVLTLATGSRASLGHSCLACHRSGGLGRGGRGRRDRRHRRDGRDRLRCWVRWAVDSRARGGRIAGNREQRRADGDPGWSFHDAAIVVPTRWQVASAIDWGGAGRWRSMDK